MMANGIAWFFILLFLFRKYFAPLRETESDDYNQNDREVETITQCTPKKSLRIIKIS